MPPVERAAQLLLRARAVCVLTGAGVSAESGVATFRDAQTGLWARYDPETLASPQGFAADPGLVWRWYMARFGGVREARPNAGHLALARLEAWTTGGNTENGSHAIPLAGRSYSGPRSSPGRFLLFTQNVDDLHERAGSRAV